MVDPSHLLPTASTVRSAVADGTLTVTASGELDVATCERLVEAVTAIQDHDVLVLDLREITFLDSSGIRSLLIARRNAQAHGAALRIRSSAAVRRTLELTGLDGELSVDP